MYRRLAILAVAFILTCAGAFGLSSGNHLDQLGVSYLTLNQNYSTSAGTQNLTVSGLGLNVLGMTPAPLGLLYGITLGYALSGTAAGTVLNMSSYDTRYLFNLMLGLGYVFLLAPKIDLLVGGGVQNAVAFIMNTSTYASVNSADVLGFAAVADLRWNFTQHVGLGVELSGAYDAFQLESMDPSVTFQNGFAYSAAAGLTVDF